MQNETFIKKMFKTYKHLIHVEHDAFFSKDYCS